MCDAVETREEQTRRYAQNRYDLRMKYRFKLEDGEKEDWTCAEEQIRREDARKLNEK